MKMRSAEKVSQTFVVSDADGGRSQMILTFRKINPFEVNLTLNTDDDINWVFARDILRDGMKPGIIGGLSDVLAWSSPGDNKFYIRLSSPDGEATLTFRRSEIRQFVHAIYEITPRETEEINVDVVISRILMRGLS